MVLENQQLGVKNVAFLTPKSFFFVNLQPINNILWKNDPYRTCAICWHCVNKWLDHHVGIYAPPMAIKQ